MTGMGQVQDRYGTGPGWVWDRYGTVSGQVWDRSMIGPGQIQNRSKCGAIVWDKSVGQLCGARVLGFLCRILCRILGG